MRLLKSRRRELQATSYATHTSHPFSWGSHLAPFCCRYSTSSRSVATAELLYMQKQNLSPYTCDFEYAFSPSNSCSFSTCIQRCLSPMAPISERISASPNALDASRRTKRQR